MKIKKLLSTLAISLIVFLSGIVTLILFPQPLFSESYAYKNFEIHSDREIEQDDFNGYLDKAYDLIKKSELYNADYRFDIFLAKGTFYNKIDDVLLGEWSAARAIDNNVVIKNQVQEKIGIVKNGENQFALDYVLAHEMIHCLQENKYGKIKFNPLSHPPMWKLEGYPEYISRNQTINHPDYTLKKGITKFLQLSKNMSDHNIIQTSHNESTPYIYYKGRLMTEYLMDIRAMSYDDILSDQRTESEIYDEMIRWYRS